MQEPRWTVEPEVAGELGDHTVIDTRVHPPVVSHLEHRFEGWLGDALLECFPCFIVTSDLAKALTTSGLTGFELADVEISRSVTFEDLYPRRVIPEFARLKVVGGRADADFRLTDDFRLSVSARALTVLRRHPLSHATIHPAARTV